VSTLDDDALQVRVMDKQPATIEEALSIAIRLEAYEAALRVFETPPSQSSKGEGHSESKNVHTVDSSESDTERQLQMQMRALKREFADYKSQKSSREQATPRSSPSKKTNSPTAQVPSESSRQGATAGQTRGRGKGGSRGRVQCGNCDKFGHRDNDCMRPPRYSPPPPKEEEVELKSIWSSSARGVAQANFGERVLATCTLDACARRNMVEPALVHRAAIEPFDNDEWMHGKPDPKAIGQYCTVFRINQEYLVTMVADVVPGTSGVTLGSDCLNDNVSRWNLNSGKVETYDGSFHAKMERDVRMIRP